MYTIKRIDAKKPANYELMVYATMSDVHEQLSRLGADNEDNFNYAVDEWYDAPANTLIFTTSNSRGHKYEVRTIGLYGYSTEDNWAIEGIIRGLERNPRYLKLVKAIVDKCNE